MYKIYFPEKFTYYLMAFGIDWLFPLDLSQKTVENQN